MLTTITSGHGRDQCTVVLENGEFATILRGPDTSGQWDRDQFGINVAAAKLGLDRMIEQWIHEAHTWWCGQQDHFGEMMDEVVEFCGYRSYYERKDLTACE